MKRTKLLHEVRIMRFEEACSTWAKGRLTQEEAAQILGVSSRTFNGALAVYHGPRRLAGYDSKGQLKDKKQL